jgi:hypothetical protein
MPGPRKKNSKTLLRSERTLRMVRAFFTRATAVGSKKEKNPVDSGPRQAYIPTHKKRLRKSRPPEGCNRRAAVSTAVQTAGLANQTGFLGRESDRAFFES